MYDTEYLVDGNRLGFVASDADRNLVVFRYAPESRESGGGNRLLRKGDYCLGSHVNTFFRWRRKEEGEAGALFSCSLLASL